MNNTDGVLSALADVSRRDFMKLCTALLLSLFAISFAHANETKQIVLKVKVSPDDTMQGALSAVFGFMPRLAISSVCGFAVSQSFDIWSYQFIRKFRPSYRDIWIRNNGSTMLSQLIDNLVFTTIAFYGVYPIDVMINIFLSTYIIKFIVAICDTPFIYLADKMFRDKKIPEDV